MNTKSDTRQLQFFDRKTKTYVPHAQQGALSFDDIDSIRKLADGRPWRVAKAERPTENPKHRAPRSDRYGRTIAEVQDEYAHWAEAQGLSSITAFAGKPLPLHYFYGRVVRVNADDYFSVTEESES